MKGLNLEENSLIHKIRIVLRHELLETVFFVYVQKIYRLEVWKCHTVEMISFNINGVVPSKANARQVLGFVLKHRCFLLLAKKKWDSTLVINNLEYPNFDTFQLWYQLALGALRVKNVLLRRGFLWLFFSSGLTVCHHRIGIQEMSLYF